MSTQIFSEIADLYIRDIDRVIVELELLDNDDLFNVHGDVSNSIGILVQHIVGNLNHFIGAVLGKNGYVRNRDNEFKIQPVNKQNLINDLIEVKKIVYDCISSLNDELLYTNYPIDKHGDIVSYNHMLIHLYGHLNYHLGQINYLRRTLNKK